VKNGRLLTMLSRLERSLPRRCEKCANRPHLGKAAYLLNGKLQTVHGEPMEEADLRPCPACGRGEFYAVRVVEGLDPACL
jgi:hypothetical protein